MKREVLWACLMAMTAIITLALSFYICLVWYRHAHPYLYALGLGPTRDDVLWYGIISVGIASLVTTLIAILTSPKPHHDLLPERAYFDQRTGYWISHDNDGHLYWYAGNLWVRYDQATGYWISRDNAGHLYWHNGYVWMHSEGVNRDG